MVISHYIQNLFDVNLLFIFSHYISIDINSKNTTPYTTIRKKNKKEEAKNKYAFLFK